MYIEGLTLFHVALSLVGIFAGFVVMGGMLCGQRMARTTAVFLLTTTVTSLTGYLFPVDRVLPAHIVGAVSLVALAAAIAGLYYFQLHGRWRRVYVIGALAAQYFNVFVLVVQMFQKIPALKALAPTQSEPSFLVTQGAVLILFFGLGFAAARSFRSA